MLVYLFVFIVLIQWLTNQFSLKYYGHFPVTAAIPYNLPLPTKGTDRLSLFALSFLPVNSIFSLKTKYIFWFLTKQTCTKYYNTYDIQSVQ